MSVRCLRSAFTSVTTKYRSIIRDDTSSVRFAGGVDARLHVWMGMPHGLPVTSERSRRPHSNVTPAQIAEGRRICEIACVQNHYNVAHRDDDALIDSLAVDRIAYVVFSARRIHTASVIDVIRCGAGSRRDANASRARMAASPSAKHSSHSRYVVLGASSGEPRGSGSRSARRSGRTVGRLDKSTKWLSRR